MHSILYWINKDDPQGPQPINPDEDSQFERWEGPVRAWAQENGYSSNTKTEPEPSVSDDIHTPENQPVININGIQDNTTVNKKGSLQFSVGSSGRYPLLKVMIYINNSYIATLTNNPFTTTINMSELNNLQIKNELRVVGFDSVYNKGEKVINFSVLGN